MWAIEGETVRGMKDLMNESNRSPSASPRVYDHTVAPVEISQGAIAQMP